MSLGWRIEQGIDWLREVERKIENYGLVDWRPPANIALWGSKGAGKTTYLALLQIAASQAGWSMKACDGDSEAFLERARHTLTVRGTFPEPTRLDDARIYSYWVSRERSYLETVAGRHCTFQVQFLDASGEWFEGQASGWLFGQADPAAYLARCQGIICLLDPERMQREGAAYADLVAGALERVAQAMGLGHRARLTQRVGFVLTKIDEPAHWPERGDARDYARRLVGRAGIERILHCCSRRRSRFFSASAIGRYGEGPNYERRDGQLHIVDTQNIRPYGLFEPLQWMLERL